MESFDANEERRRLQHASKDVFTVLFVIAGIVAFAGLLGAIAKSLR